MKKTISLLLALVLCLSLVACGKKDPTPAPIVVDGKEVTVADFLIEHLSEYIQSEGYLEREKRYEEMTGNNAPPLTVTKVIEVNAWDLGMNELSVHFLAVKAECMFLVDESGIYDSILLVVDYETGEVYDEFTVDPSYQTMENTKEHEIWVMLHGPLVGAGYDGGPILGGAYDGNGNLVRETETRVELPEKDIGKINEALQK